MQTSWPYTSVRLCGFSTNLQVVKNDSCINIAWVQKWNQLTARDKPHVESEEQEEAKRLARVQRQLQMQIWSGEAFLRIFYLKTASIVISQTVFYCIFFFRCDKNVKSPEGDKTGSCCRPQLRGHRLARMQHQRQFHQNWVFKTGNVWHK